MARRRYEVLVHGPVDAELLRALTEAHTDVEVQTVLQGTVRDQADLQGLLRTLHGSGLELLELHQVEPDDALPADDASPARDASPDDDAIPDDASPADE
jgi:hypothetical protein